MHKRQATQLNRFHTLSPRKLFRIFRIRGQDKIAYCEALSRDSLLSIYSLLMRPEFRPCLWRCLTSPFQGSCSKTVWRSLSGSFHTANAGTGNLEEIQRPFEGLCEVLRNRHRTLGTPGSESFRLAQNQQQGFPYRWQKDKEKRQLMQTLNAGYVRPKLSVQLSMCPRTTAPHLKVFSVLRFGLSNHLLTHRIQVFVLWGC